MMMMMMYHVSSREQVDAQVAKQLAEKMEREELERRQALEEGDQEIARKLQVSMVASLKKFPWTVTCWAKLVLLVVLNYCVQRGKSHETLDFSYNPEMKVGMFYWTRVCRKCEWISYLTIIRTEYRLSQHVFTLENLKAEDNLGDLDIDGIII